MLDDYFDAVTSPIQSRGGEVLKFVGDGVLAIFATGAGDEAHAVRQALAAAEEALARIDAVNTRRGEAGQAMFRIGIGLHVGTVFYGNVGAADRLDFTAIGPAVNLVCRLETLTKRLDRPLVVSRDAAHLAGRPMVALGFLIPCAALPSPRTCSGYRPPASGDRTLLHHEGGNYGAQQDTPKKGAGAQARRHGAKNADRRSGRGQPHSFQRGRA